MENGQECLGYADVPEGKKETKRPDANRIEDENEEYEEGKGADSAAHLGNGQKRHSNGSPQLRRAEPAYFDNGPRSGRGSYQKGTAYDYRDTAIFSDEDTSPLGM